ncbi:APC family permease [Paenibacillus pabuli]|uniref:APC family permease n=1 Tax=Paenibacillus pabuli TaxID=1472 RepID=UPI000785C079|nr:APC family permease [Paenibacillus pabuli]MEC0125348.1 APC family permease [Paenibacillus pabuli]
MIVRVIAIILLLLGVVRLFLPDFIRLPNIKIDGYVLFFIVSGLVVWNHRRLVELYKRTVRYKNNILKVSIISLCITVIILRMFSDNIRFDNTSLYILVLLIVTTLIPDLKDLLLRIKRFKKGDFELELSEIVQELKDKVEEVEEKQTKNLIKDNKEPKNDSLNEEDVVKEAPEEYEVSTKKVKRDPFEEQIKELIDHPVPLIILISSEIEKRVRLLVLKENNKMYLNHRAAMKEAVNKKIISKDIWILNEKFMKIRNYAAHGHNSAFNEIEIYEAIELGLRILKLLPKETPQTEYQEPLK